MDFRRPRRWSHQPIAIALLVGAAGCASGARPGARTPEHDRPIAPSEPRATLALRIDLEPGPRCEERFDLDLYRDRRVELVAWDAQRFACSDRAATIHYLSRQLSRAALLTRVRELARRAKPIREATSHAKP